jgi:kynurenine formamidase
MSDLALRLGAARLVDLTQPLGPATALWPGSRPFAATTVADFEPDGCYARELEVPEHAGTHFDAPIHFDRHGRAVAEIEIQALVCPAVKLDVRSLVAGDPSSTVDAAAIRGIEERDGVIPEGSAVLVHTGWDAHWQTPATYLGQPDLAFPGLTRDAAELLVERGIAGLGIDTLSVDPGDSVELPVHTIVLPAGIWQLEGLIELEQVPARGSWLVTAPLRLVGGSGAPARVFAILPDA